MKKKIFGGIAVLAIAAVAAWNVSVNKQTEGFSTIMLANVQALAQESNPIKCSRIVRTCNCKSSSNPFAGVSVLECEEYIWQPPMVRLSCSLTNCQLGTSCY